MNYDHSSPIGCCLKFSHLIGPEGGFKFVGRKIQRSEVTNDSTVRSA